MNISGFVVNVTIFGSDWNTFFSEYEALKLLVIGAEISVLKFELPSDDEASVNLEENWLNWPKPTFPPMPFKPTWKPPGENEDD